MKIYIPWNELIVLVSRSSGAGGQHVNRTNSAVQLRFNIGNSLTLSEEQKLLIRQKLRHKLTQSEDILVRCESERDQRSNKMQAYQILNDLINSALKKEKQRIATKPTRSSIRKIATEKKARSEVKKSRKKPNDWS